MVSDRSSAAVILAVAIAAVVSAALAIAALRHEARVAGDAENRLIALRLDLVRLGDIPWGAAPAETADPQPVRDELLGAREDVLDVVGELARDPGLPERTQFLAHFRTAYDALEQVLDAVAAQDDEALGAAPDTSLRQLYAADTVLQGAADRLRSDARRADRQEALGSVVLIGLLFLAFAVYVVWLTRARRAQARMSAELETTRDAALEASRAKSMFLASMSHELRTPLTVVLLNAEVLQLTPLDGEQSELLARMRRNGEVLRRLISEVLDFSRIEAGQVEILSERFDLRGVLRDIEDAFTLSARDKPFTFRWEVAPDVPSTFVGDWVRLVQVVTNLLDNAFKFTQDGQVSVVVRRAGDLIGVTPGAEGHGGEVVEVVEVVVEDTGIGIPPDRLASVFESFKQADASIGRRYGGSGLGLAISQQLCRRMGGSLTVRSEEDLGSTFEMRVPNREAEGAVPAGVG